jgi:hypothetical protein
MEFFRTALHLNIKKSLVILCFLNRKELTQTMILVKDLAVKTKNRQKIAPHTFHFILFLLEKKQCFGAFQFNYAWHGHHA